ncbi:hypothetical protein QJS10_CPA05g01952 [Acorus calamus]|uniref:Trichome birefringence-like N-terminal domain-containing protein n=1 Tax=Acorus calamus TaxID=4465 RepID=A0AAV9EX89_ACOCL|nr:hypothetical protein QJS10_CPA05g01952 [Acorus calamus]
MKPNHHQDHPLKELIILPKTQRSSVLTLSVTLILITIASLYFSLPTSFSIPSPPPVDTNCDVFDGEWIPDPNATYYTNNTCSAIHEHQNCMKYGRPDTDFLRWRWKPNGCDLPRFDAEEFLSVVRGKSLAFIGDSVGRNQMQSLICLLSKVAYPNLIAETKVRDQTQSTWHYPTSNFTLSNFWSPFLLLASEANPTSPSPSGLFHLHLDRPDPAWTAHLSRFDYLIFSAGHWFFRPLMLYNTTTNNTTIISCANCKDMNITHISVYDAYRLAFRSTFSALKGFKGTAFLRTFSPSHFEGGVWNNGGDCVRTRPFKAEERRLEWFQGEMYRAQVEEFRAAAERESGGVRFGLLDVTAAMSMRPDGHPGRYGHPKNETKYNDCVHWCLPGPVDVWNGFLLHLLKVRRIEG